MNIFLKSILVVIICDLVIVAWMMSSIADGRQVQHIPFWDNQLQVISKTLW